MTAVYFLYCLCRYLAVYLLSLLLCFQYSTQGLSGQIYRCYVEKLGEFPFWASRDSRSRVIMVEALSVVDATRLSLGRPCPFHHAVGQTLYPHNIQYPYDSLCSLYHKRHLHF